jgi:hypothetical protein
VCQLKHWHTKRAETLGPAIIRGHKQRKSMTSLFFETENEIKLDIDTVYFNYDYGYIEYDRCLEGLQFIVKIVNQKLEWNVHPDCEVRFNTTLNTKYWLKTITKLFSHDYAEFTHPKTGEVIFLRTPDELAH